MKNFYLVLCARMLTCLAIGFLSTSAGGSKAIKVTQPAVVVADKQGNAHLACSYTFRGKAMEIRTTLRKEEGEKSTVMCAASYTTEYEPFTSEGAIICQGQPGPGNVTLKLSGLRAANTGVYTCVIEIMYPPPYRMSVGNGTLVYITDPEPCNASHLFYWVLLGTAAALLIYSVLITAVLVGNKLRKKSWLCAGLYSNMTPSGPAQETKVNAYHILIN